MGTERVIKRYTNRKLYDTDQSRYVTLEDIARLVRENEEVRVIDNETQADLTAVTFAQIILEEEKRKTNLVSVPFLRKLIHSGEAAVQDLSDSAKRALDQLGEITERAGGRVREVVEEGGRAIDEGLGLIDDLINLPQRRLENLRDVARKQVDRLRQNPSLQREIERLEKSIQSIESMLNRLRDSDDKGEDLADDPFAGEDLDEEVAAEDAVISPEIEDEKDDPRAVNGD
jgi:polyhydroxyalkanoate synthesis repressor PhaR